MDHVDSLLFSSDHGDDGFDTMPEKQVLYYNYLTLLHSKKAKIICNLVFLSAIGLKQWNIFLIFSSPVQTYAIAVSPLVVWLAVLGLAKCRYFTLKFFYVIGKALSGELSCTRTGLVRLDICFVDIYKQTIIVQTSSDAAKHSI